MQDTITVAGIDTSKAKLDIAIHGSSSCWRVDNTPAGFKLLATQLATAKVSKVGIEATGGYENGVVAYLRASGLEVHVLQPMQVKALAHMKLMRAKNDRIDARLIAACTALVEPQAVEPDQRLEPLAHHLTFVEQIEEDIARIKTRLEHIHDKRLKDIATRDIARLKKRRNTELRRIVKDLEMHADLARRLELVNSIDGIGERTAIALIVRMPELGHISREEAAALAGLAPYDDDSGGRKGIRRIAGGRSRVRRSLYAAAMPAAFYWNSGLNELYQRLTKKGKPHKLALIACARKLLVFANTVLERDTPWVSLPRPARSASV